MEIVDIYYADCDREAGPRPRWSTVRSGGELRDERSLERLRSQLDTLRRKRRKRAFAFGDEVIQVDHDANGPVQGILQRILGLPEGEEALAELQGLGDVLAAKYLATPYARTRLFMVARGRGGEGLRLFTLVADLKSAFEGEYIDPGSLDFTSRTIPNWIGGLKKGAIYPALREGERDEAALEIYDENETRYYPHSLECVPRPSQSGEAESLMRVMDRVAGLTPDQAAGAMRELRELDAGSFGSEELADALERSGAAVDREIVARAWRRRFPSARYRISPDVLARDSVTVTIRLDDFEIQCPLSYYPDRIEHREQGGYHYVRVRGREYREVRVGKGRIRFGPGGE